MLSIKGKGVWIKLLAMIVIFLCIKSVYTQYAQSQNRDNLFVLQSQAFLQQRLDIQTPHLDAAPFEGKFYVPFPPFPSILLLPFVYIFGSEHTSTILVSTFLTLLNIYVLFSLLKQQELENWIVNWSLMGFFLGTGYWYALQWSGNVWFFAHIVAVSCLLLAMHEAFGKGRGWLTGIYLGSAILSRQLTLFALPFLLVALWQNKKDLKNLGMTFIPLVLWGCFYLWLNWARFHEPLDTGYSYLPLEDPLKAHFEKYGLFNLAYLPFNVIYLFFQGFHVEFNPPDYIKPHCLDPFGTSLTFASPFVFIAFWARKSPLLISAAWISITLMILISLLYYANGFYQLNTQRFTLDYLPLLIFLVALGTRKVNETLFKVLISYSIFMNVLTHVLCHKGS